MPAIISPNPKRVRVFIKPNGQVIEGGIEEAYGMGPNMVRTGGSNQLPGKTEETETGNQSS